MSCSMSRVDCPWSASRRSRAPSSSLSAVSRPAAGSSRQSTSGLAASARATPTSLRWPVDSCDGIASAAQCMPTRASVSSAIPSRDATVRFSWTLRSSNSSVLCQVRASPRLARSYAGSPRRLAPDSSTVPVLFTKPEMASMRVVLPAPFGPISPTSSPSFTSSVTSLSACTPPKLTERPVTRSAAGWPDRSGREVRGVSRSRTAPSASGAWTCGRLCVRR